jgi:hypothetical protein
VKHFKRPAVWVTAVLLAGALGGALWYFYLRQAQAARMLAMLPAGDGTTLFVDTALLRRAGLLEKLAGQAGTEEQDYRRFVEATGFNYRTDLDALLVRFRQSDTLMVVAGGFDLDKLKTYALAHGGRCAANLCSVQGSAPERQISWMPLGRRLLAVGVGADPMAAALIGGGERAAFRPPEAALWFHLPGAELRPREGLAPGLSAFLSGLDGARYAVLSVERRGTDFAVALEAPAESAAQAGAMAERLTRNTEMITKLLARENRKPDPAELAGILASGTFRVEGSVVRGSWPVPAAFAERLGK